MDKVTKIYKDVLETMLGQFLDDIKTDTRDIPNCDLDFFKQTDGKFSVILNIFPSTHPLVYSGRYS